MIMVEADCTQGRVRPSCHREDKLMERNLTVLTAKRNVTVLYEKETGRAHSIVVDASGQQLRHLASINKYDFITLPLDVYNDSIRSGEGVHVRALRAADTKYTEVMGKAPYKVPVFRSEEEIQLVKDRIKFATDSDLQNALDTVVEHDPFYPILLKEKVDRGAKR